YAAEDYYISLEQNLQSKVDNIETTYAGYDEYNYNIAGIGHNPYELISYLTAVYQDFTFTGIKSELDTLFNQQYHLQISERAETRTDADGNEYTYKILNATLKNSGFTSSMNAEQQELYAIYLETKGNRDYLFADDIYSNVATSPYNDYTIPSAALSDATFRKLITEAEKYLGYPYVWGGSSSSTSFDCSGFVCWVFRNSGVYPLSRTTAQGIYNQCAKVRPSDAKPGDIIFFTGTYKTSDAVTHVGIYVGNNMMIHCGNPIQYASTQSSYWTQHFYAYGRLSQ
ncbi:MAG: C40 family peptidase, partial [Clostridia bacterium]|nr:C40 family peptidase [Clostridia bacterium]